MDTPTIYFELPWIKIPNIDPISESYIKRVKSAHEGRAIEEKNEEPYSP